MTLGDHAHILYPIESAIVSAWRQDTSLLDVHVLDAVAALARKYSLEADGRSFRMPRMDSRAENLANDLAVLCEWLLGRAMPTPNFDGVRPQISLADLAASLKRLKKSIATWSEQRGRQGYLTYVAEFLPQIPDGSQRT